MYICIFLSTESNTSWCILSCRRESGFYFESTRRKFNSFTLTLLTQFHFLNCHFMMKWRNKSRRRYLLSKRTRLVQFSGFLFCVCEMTQEVETNKPTASLIDRALIWVAEFGTSGLFSSTFRSLERVCVRACVCPPSVRRISLSISF